MSEQIEELRQLILQENSHSPDSLAKILSHIFNAEKDLIDINKFLQTDTLPTQTFIGQQFSQFPITVLNERGHHLDIYHWRNAHTSIHDHNFQGAFKVIKGNYRQKIYSFKSTIKVFDWLEIGELTLKEDKVLLPGSIVTIPRGQAFIHSNEHSDGECVTACLRTAVPEGPIHTYIRPGLKLTHTIVDRHAQKVLDYIHYLSDDLINNKLKIKESFSLIDKNYLFQVVFSYNVPKWLAHSELRSIAYKLLIESFHSEPWFKSVKESFILEKLDSI